MKAVEFNLKNYLENRRREEARMIVESEAKTIEECMEVFEKIHDGVEKYENIRNYIIGESYDECSYNYELYEIKRTQRDINEFNKFKKSKIFKMIKDFWKDKSKDKLETIKNSIEEFNPYNIKIDEHYGTMRRYLKDGLRIIKWSYEFPFNTEDFETNIDKFIEKKTKELKESIEYLENSLNKFLDARGYTRDEFDLIFDSYCEYCDDEDDED